ncbi:hypothetical protein Vqi01_56780 [Micromonospora qiuiae]|uniref:Uncharacterized protein n=1 Tax=Micromonospora qiuiae TaxID=502268 RepID=A0ABQ4JJA7_9ACTN|nr:hypothetical protein Vqi01_56780 [Micromonospora qiuiae]
MWEWWRFVAGSRARRARATRRMKGHARPARRVTAIGAGGGGASVPGRPSKLKGTTRRKRRPYGPPLTSEPLRPSGRSRGQADGLPFMERAANSVPDSSPITRGSVKVRFTQRAGRPAPHAGRLDGRR